MGRIRSGSSGRIALRTKRIICFSGWRARRLGRTTSIITGLIDYSGFVTALGDRAGDSSLTMKDLYESKAVLMIGNDPTSQNPLVAWQVRSGIRHHNTRLYILNARDVKLERKATQFVKVAEGQEVAAIRWMGSEQGQLEPALVEKLVQLKAALDAEPEVAIVFGAEISGAAIAELVAFGSKLQGKVRYMALGDYANSRGAADMGVLA